MRIKKISSVSLKRKLCFFLPLLLLIVLGIGNVAFSGQLVNQGEKIHALEISSIQLALHEKDLETNLAGLQSLHAIQLEALAQGYVPRANAVFVDDTRPVALR